MTEEEQELDWRIRVFDSLSFPTVILKPDRSIIAVNRIYLEKWRVTEADVLGRTCGEVNRSNHPDKIFPCDKKERCPMFRAVRTGEGQHVMIKCLDRFGEERWEDRVFSPILGEGGEVRYVIESIRDVTRVKNLEKAYSEAWELIDKVVQSSASGIIAADHSGRIILMNTAAEELFGLRAYDTDQVNIEECYPPGVAREIMRKLRDEQIGGKGKLPVTRVNIRDRQGREVPVEMTAAIIYEDGEEAATAGIFNDLREKLSVEHQLRDAQAQLIQSEKMASLGRLAAGVAHEINNPLTSILLYGSLMREQMEPGHPMEMNLQYVLEDTERCREIVKNLLLYSRQTSPSRHVFQLNELIDESLRLIRDQKLFLHLEVVKDKSSDHPLVNADRHQLCQVVINLIINAIDAMDGVGRLTLGTYRDEQAGLACLTVADTGCGISQDNVSKIFDPFFTTKAVGKGTGLGLSMAYGIMEDNQGRILLKKTGPTGTTFELQLPEVPMSSMIMFDSIG